MSQQCSIDLCDKPSRKKTWCVAHYERWRRYGDPEGVPTPKQRQSDDERRRVIRDHYLANKQAYIDRAVAHKKKTKIELRSIIDEKKSVPCVDCRVQYSPWVMQFDHVRGEKLFDIGNATSKVWSTSVLLDEIEKCEVVCSNCHAERTHARMMIEGSAAVAE